MDDNHILKELLESLFSNKDLKSWTCHDNNNGSTVTLRFVDASAATRGNQSVAKTTTYRQKSPKQIARDKDRRENFHNRVNTRSRTETEMRRHGDDSDELTGECNMSSASSICSIPSQSSEVEVTVSSPTLNSTTANSKSPPVTLPESAPVVEIPDIFEKHSDIPDLGENGDKTTQKLKLRASADGVDSELFYEHISNRSEIEYDNIKCNHCPIFMRSVAIEAGWYRLMYCEQCDGYICTRCRPPPNTGTMTHSSSCSSTIYFIT